jgi:hypothetical protein
VKELLDVVTRVYEYQRPHPALVGTASGLETVRLALQGKLPDSTDLSRRWALHSLMRARAAASSRVLRPNGNTITSEPSRADLPCRWRK